MFSAGPHHRDHQLVFAMESDPELTCSLIHTRNGHPPSKQQDSGYEVASVKMNLNTSIKFPATWD